MDARQTTRTALPLLGEHEREGTYCTHCPKLCTFTCPVSTVTGREATTPWAKMTSAHQTARGDLQWSSDVAQTWSACTGCLKCTDNCAHHNDVPLVLHKAQAHDARTIEQVASRRAALLRLARREAHAAEVGRGAFGAPTGASVAYVPGCSACVVRPNAARDGARVVEACHGAADVIAQSCCGLPWLESGDVDGFIHRATSMHRALEHYDVVVFLDPGCQHAVTKRARALHLEGASSLEARAVHITQTVAAQVSSFRGRTTNAAPDHARARYHDPCRLGRGLGVFEAPRTALRHVLGYEVAEFFQHGAHADCSGAGGQLPRTDRNASTAIAAHRIDAHKRAGGGAIVTACPASANAFARNSSEPVLDFVSVIAAALPKNS